MSEICCDDEEEDDDDGESDYDESWICNAIVDLGPPPPPKYWCYLMVNFQPEQKINTYIGKTKDPPKKVEEHNQRKAKGQKTTKAAAPYWSLEMIIGPFNDKGSAIEFRDKWKQKSRGIQSRRQRGLDLSDEYHVEVFDERQNPKTDSSIEDCE